MTSPLQMNNALRARVANHLYVNKNPYVNPNDPSGSLSWGRKARFNYSWKPDKAEAHRIKRLSKGYGRPTSHP